MKRGSKFTAEQLQRLIDSHRKEEARIKVSLVQKGRKHKSQEGFQKGHKPFSDKGRFTKGIVPWNKGKTGVYSKDVRKKMGDYMRGRKQSVKFIEMLKNRRGDKHPNWRGGISYLPYSIDWTDTLKQSIRERDKYICFICHSRGWAVHHIDYNKKNCNPNNLITLCVSCHTKTNYKREHWLNYFNITLWQDKEN